MSQANGQQKHETFESYKNGAVTALAYMAKLGVNKSDVFSVAADMDISFDDIDEGDRELLLEAFGDLSAPIIG